MIRPALLLLAPLTLLGGTLAQAQAALSPEMEQTYASALGQCVSLKSTGEDRIILARWFVAVLASAPKVVGVAKVDPGEKDGLDRAVAGIFTRLITKDCAEQARPLWKARSSAGFRATGEALGRLAMVEVLSGGDADMVFAGYVHYINPADFKVLEQ